MKGQFIIKTSKENVIFISKSYDDYNEMEEKVAEYVSGAHDNNGHVWVTLEDYRGVDIILQGGHFMYPSIIEFIKGE